jgi:uncharacterized damage-inducible protein DinB
MKLIVSLAICSIFSIAAFAADEAKSAPKFSAEFAKHWNSAKELTLAVAEAMPAENYDFKPNAEEMSFGEQVVHIGQGNYAYCSRMTGAKSPFTKPEKIDKATAMKIVGESFDFCAAQIGPLSDEQMTQMRGQTSVRELAMGAMTHMAHHRGQIEVYLRLKNIKPPTYKF